MDTFIKPSLEDLLGCINGKDQDGKDFVVVKKRENDPDRLVKVEFEKYVNRKNDERRKMSTVSNLRSFHNFIKQTLITNVTNLYKSQHPKEQISLLDIAVGRGGDMWKWAEAGIANVYGFDKSTESINSINPFDQGAKERYLKAKEKFKKFPLCEYNVGNAIQPTPELIDSIQSFSIKHKLINKNPKFSGFQIMSCQFAMHYFFHSEVALRNVLGVFSNFLRTGGYFIGTTVDGRKITKLLGKEKNYNSDLLSIEKRYSAETPTDPFGKGYIFRLNDTVDKGNYFNTIGESLEYLVYFEKLIKIASEYNLQPVYLNFFERIKNNEYTRTDYPIPHFVSFEEIYKLVNFKKQLNPNEIEINNLYSTFVFIKISP